MFLMLLILKESTVVIHLSWCVMLMYQELCVGDLIGCGSAPQTHALGQETPEMV